MNETAKAKVSTTPKIPAAERVWAGDANAALTASETEPARPKRTARLCTISARTRSGTIAATTMMNGNSETNALAASAIDRSTNSTSSNLDQNRPGQ